MGSRHTRHHKNKKEMEEIRKLRRQLKVLKSFPNNFRDADPQSRAYQDMMNVTDDLELKKRMTDWLRGPILYIHPLTKIERKIMGPDRLVRAESVVLNFDDFDIMTHFEARLHVCKLSELMELMKEASTRMIDDGSGEEPKPISFIMVKNLPEEVFKGLNALCRYSNRTFRFQMELTDKNGLTPGL